MKNDNSRKYLISAIIWTVVALSVMALLVFAGSAEPVGMLGALALVVMCIVGQWLRYFKSR